MSTKAPQSLRVTVERGRAMVAAPAILDIFTAPHVRADLAEAAERSESGDIVVLVGAVEFCDSAGLGCLIAAYKRALDRGGRVYLVRPSARLFELLHRTGTMQLFELLEDQSELPPADAGGARV